MTDPPQPAKTPEPPYYAAIFTSLRTERDGEIVGFGQIFPSDVVEMLHCDPAHARRGTGGRLLAALEERARSQGQVVLDTNRVCGLARFSAGTATGRWGGKWLHGDGVAIPRLGMRKMLPNPPHEFC